VFVYFGAYYDELEMCALRWGEQIQPIKTIRPRRCTQ
jgi:hypothetical protein